MVNLEKKSVDIQNRMHDSVTQNFDRVSDLNDNDSTPLQGQQDEQPEGVNTPEMPLYPARSPDTNDM